MREANYRFQGLGSSSNRRRQNCRGLRLEALEPRRVLATVVWDGGGDGTSWSDAANWNVGGVDQLPASGDDVTIDVPGSNPVITYDTGSVTLASLTSEEALHIAAGSITMTGAAQINADLTMGDADFVADGAAASINATSSSSLTFATLKALNGATVTVPATSFSEGNATLEANGAGSLLDLSTITTLSGGGFIRTLVIRADNGGLVDLSGLTEITGGATHLVADGAGSRIDATSLTSFVDTNGNRSSLIEPKLGGEVDAPLLTDLSAVNITLDPTGVLSTSQITSYTSGTFSVETQQLDLSALVDMTNSKLVVFGGANADVSNASTIAGSSFEVYDGVTLALPNAVAYSGQSNSGTIFRAQGAGSQLDLSSLTTLSGGSFISTLFIEALDGGVIDFNNLAEITGGATNIQADGPGSTIELPALGSFHDNNGNRESVLEPTNGGTINAPQLTSVSSVRITLDGTGTLPTAQMTSVTGSPVGVHNVFADFGAVADFTNSSMTLRTGGTTDLSGATMINGASFFVHDGVTLAVPGGTSYFGQTHNGTWFRAEGAGSTLDLSAITDLNGGSFISALVIEALNGGTVDLSGAPSIAGGATWITADGGSVDLAQTNLVNDTNGNVSSTTTALNGGIVDFGSQSVTFNHVTISLTDTGTLQADTFELGAGAILNGAGALNANLINAGRVIPGSSPGLQTILGDYTQTAAGSLEVELGGLVPVTDHDVLQVTGHAAFDGTLSVTLINGLGPVELDSFDIVSYTSASGEFNAHVGTDLASGLVLDPVFGASDLTLNAFPELSLMDASIVEGDAGISQLVFDVAMSVDVGYDVFVDFQTADDFATGGDDYAITLDTLMIPAGNTTGIVAVDILGDVGLERDETFFVSLISPVDAALGDVLAVGTIFNDDILPAIEIGDTEGVEPPNGTTPFAFEVTLSAPAPDLVTVNFATSDVSAIGGTDYVADNGAVIFQASAARGLVSDGSDGAFAPNSHVTVSLPADGILNYTSVDIPSHVTVTYLKNAANTPVILLAQNDIVIDGAINISASSFNGGPGGGEGGLHGEGIEAGMSGTGLSPGAGGGAIDGFVGGAGGGGGLATDGLDPDNRPGPNPGSGGDAVPFPETLNDRGGSGGGGGGGWKFSGVDLSGSRGGGGGGGLVAASSHGAIMVGGTISANGAHGGTAFANAFGWGGAGGGGSGGVIDLQADRIEITGTLEAVGGEGGGISTVVPGTPTFSSGAHGGLGYVRLTSDDLTVTGQIDAELVTRDLGLSQTVVVQVSNDADAMEPDETFEVTLSAAINGIITGTVGTGTIIDAEPGDFDGDGDFDGIDIDALVAAIAADVTDGLYELTGDGFVDLADRDAWLSLAGEANLGPGKSYLLGDATLDGFVDGTDFLRWNVNKFTSVAAWTKGDFNADGVVDGVDFIEWNINKFTQSDVTDWQDASRPLRDDVRAGFKKGLTFSGEATNSGRNDSAPKGARQPVPLTQPQIVERLFATKVRELMFRPYESEADEDELALRFPS